ncbi:DNA repair protein RadC [Gluconobacter kondonii]|nr:DNA repair protein RadC [Gluconobacter kondonii]MBS1056625.1 DNA repair protein RadC [Gluconobacter kondonii]MBS1065085.1 DNA repair protein RadC [Gluconobacter kondonii]MBS1076671.1 DNA repair protein RadC [Gluconobacter kondonii]MBS1079287.1 DNA repair protein RadC [Gluconobacter kondonii]
MTEAPSKLEPPLALLTGRGRHLDDATLLHLMTALFTGREEGSAELSHTLSTRFGSLAAVLSASSRELESITNMGTHMVPMIRLLQEAALRYNRARLPPEDVLDSEQKLLDYLTARLARENIEQFRILFLNEKNSLIADEAQARGTVNHTPVYPREVARRAVEVGASALVLVHNHPSGDPTPSEADLQMTMQVQAALDVVGVTIADHFIIGNGRHTSFRCSNLL